MPLVSSSVEKEARALLPMWTACALAICASLVVRDRNVLTLGLLVYSLGAVALGAQAIGHEYTHRTLGLLLTMPSDRRRILLIKLAVLTAMLLVLGAMAWSVLFNAGQSRRLVSARTMLVLVPIACALCVAPWLTMMSRRALAGTVFTVAIPGVMLLAGEIAGALKYGAASAEVDDFRFALWWRGMVVLCAAGAVLGWRTFMRLEFMEGSGPAIHLPQWFRGATPATAARRHPVWLLVGKELHLQQLTFAVVGIYFISWLALSVLRGVVPEFRDAPLGALSVLYPMILVLLIGSLASAEERHLGTLEWQTLLPMASWQQWIVKVAVTLGLASLLTIGLPVILNRISPSADDLHIAPFQTIVVLTATSMYVSSICISGLRAMVLAFPAMIGVMMFLPAVNWAVESIILVSLGFPRRTLVHLLAARSLDDWVPLMLAVGFASPMLWLAFLNHRSAELGGTRLRRQLAGIAVFLTLGVVLLRTVL